jgi:hypothetical protein
MASKKLRVVIPLLQVLILILAFSLDPLLGRRYVMRSDLAIAYIVTPEHLMLKLNFPLVILGLPAIYLGDLAFPQMNSRAGALGAVISGVYVLVLLASTAAFWYFIIVEVEMRKRRASCFRFSGRLMEKLKATVMILIGLSAAVYAFWDGHRLVILDQVNRHYLFWSAVVADALIGGLILIGWAVVLITMGVQDMVRVSALKVRQPHP